jgi:hypothetical protein
MKSITARQSAPPVIALLHLGFAIALCAVALAGPVFLQ